MALVAAQIIDPPPALLGTSTVQLQFNTSKAGAAFLCQLASQGAQNAWAPFPCLQACMHVNPLDGTAAQRAPFSGEPLHLAG